MWRLPSLCVCCTTFSTIWIAGGYRIWMCLHVVHCTVRATKSETSLVWYTRKCAELKVVVRLLFWQQVVVAATFTKDGGTSLEITTFQFVVNRRLDLRLFQRISVKYIYLKQKSLRLEGDFSTEDCVLQPRHTAIDSRTLQLLER